MISGLFTDKELIRRHEFALPMCGACKLHKYCETPKMAPHGSTSARVLIVGDVPSAKDDMAGRYFQGARGEALLYAVEAAGMDIADCRYTSALICSSTKEDEQLTKKVAYCRPNLLAEIEQIRPEVIIPCGKLAIEAVLGPIWKEDCGSINQWAGFQIPGRRWNAWICPTFNPKSCTNNKDASTYRLAFDAHIRNAMRLESRPWKNPPNQKSDELLVEIVYSSDRLSEVSEFLLKQPVLSFDYETDRLKPELGEIVSAAFGFKVKNRVQAVAFHIWREGAKDLIHKIVDANIPLIGANTKFETRWTERNLGPVIGSWLWDTQTAAHVLDNRQSITSVKFQAFVRLGVEPYNTHIEQYFEAKGGNTANKIHDIPTDDLLTYNGLDCVYEYMIAESQMADFGTSIEGLLE